MNTTSLDFSTNCACFHITGQLKTKKPVTIHFPKFTEQKLCVWSCFVEYWLRTMKYRTSTNPDGTISITVTSLLLSVNKPHGVAAKDTIKNWVKSLMQQAGIDITKYTVHSTRAASTSKAANLLPLSSILKAAGWAGGSTFANHYHRPIM